MQQMNKRQIIQNLKSFSIGPIVSAGLSFIATPIYTYFLSPEEMGKASMFTLACTIIQLVVFLGMDQAFAKRYYESENRSSLLTNAIFPSLILAIAVCLNILIFRRQVSYLLFGTEFELVCVYALILVIPGLAVERFGLLCVRMEQNGSLYSFLLIVLKAIVILTTLGFILIKEKTFRAIIWGQVGAQALFSILLCVVSRKQVSFRISDLNRAEMKSLLRFGIPLVPTTIIGWALNGTDKLMMRFLCNYSEIGLYDLALKVASLLTIIQSSFTTFWIPLAHQWNNEHVNVSSFVKTGKYLTCVMSLLFMFVLLTRNVALLLFKPEYYEAASIIPFLLFTPIMYTISEVTVMGIYFKEKTEWTIVISLSSAIINIALNYALIPIWGASGAAIATGLSYICFFWARTIFSRKLWFPFPLIDYYVITVLLLSAAFCNTFYDGPIEYVSNIVILSLIILYYKNEIRQMLKAGIR